MSESRRELISHPSIGYPAAWKALELLEAAKHEGRPDGTYQGGYEMGELRRFSGIDDPGFTWLECHGLIVRRVYRFNDSDPDRSWGIEIAPRGEELLRFGRMQQFLSSIASADPHSKQAEWMVRTAREALYLEMPDGSS